MLSLMYAVCLVFLVVFSNHACNAEETQNSRSPDVSAWQPVKVELRENNGRFQLLRGGAPYRLNGAGIEHGNLAAFSAHGGTSFRTWAVNNALETGQEVLDKAHKLGLTVSMCLPMTPERHGFDYDDDAAVARQFEEMRVEVLRYKDHPALLSWIIGNELNHDYKNPRAYDAVNQVSRMIHEVDPNHPTTTAIAGISKDLVDVITTRAPDLDFLSIQMYGMLVSLPRYIDEIGLTMPYFVTEWGTIGHWEVRKTAWGAPIELHSSAKAKNYLKSFEEVIRPYRHQGVGDYVFLWGQKQERTPTWYGMFLESGEETEAVDVMHYLWNGVWPGNRSPRLDSMLLNDKTASDDIVLRAAGQYTARVAVFDYEADPLSYRWSVKPESNASQSGGDFEHSLRDLAGLIEDPTAAEVLLRAPAQPGAYRLFVYAYDGQGHAAHANIPFYVNKSLVQKTGRMTQSGSKVDRGVEINEVREPPFPRGYGLRHESEWSH